MAKYISPSKRRRANAKLLGWVILTVCVACTIAMLWGAYQIDKAHGISVSQSLQSAGL